MNEKHFIPQNPEDIEKESGKEDPELSVLRNKKQRIQGAINELVEKIKEFKEESPTHEGIRKSNILKKSFQEQLEEIEQKIAEKQRK